MMTVRRAGVMLGLMLSGACARSEPERVAQEVGDYGKVTDIDALKGSWRVDAVEAPAEPASVVVHDDPAYMGAILDVDRDRMTLSLQGGARRHATCEKPLIEEDGRVRCAGGGFGPEDARLTVEASTIALEWYDGAILRLVPGDRGR